MARKQLQNIKVTLNRSEADIELRPYMTAEIDQMNQAVYLAYANLDMQAAMDSADDTKDKAANAEAAKSAVKFDKLPASAMMEIKNNALKGYVVSIDGDKFGGDQDELLKELLTLPKEDIDQLHEEIDKIEGGSNLSKKDAPKSA